MVANHAYEGRATSYGALDLSAPKDAAQSDGSSRRARTKALIVVALSAVSVAAFLFGAGKGSSATDVLSTVDRVAGDDLAKTGKDGWCNTACVQPYTYTDAIKGGEKTVPYGYCNAAPACLALSGGCMGIDYRLAKVLEKGGDMKIACAGVEGAYDCGENWPCVNGGFCIDGDGGMTCVCPFGWEGSKCELDIDECAELMSKDNDGKDVGTPSGVCDPNAMCINSDGFYTCQCEAGFVGDGYAYDQTTVTYYSVLDSDYSYGWLHRTDKDPEGNEWPDKNEDGKIDVHGCTDIDDCIADKPCKNGGRCYNLWDGAYTDELTGRRMVNDDHIDFAKGLHKWLCDCAVTLPRSRWAGEKCGENVDECAGDLNNCHVEASCEDSAGSFSCTCNNHWEGDGYSKTAGEPAEWDCTKANFCQEAEGYYGCEDIINCVIAIDLGVDADQDGENDVEMQNVCRNGGTCSETGLFGTGDHHCKCTEGFKLYELQNCHKDMDECSTDIRTVPEEGCDVNAHCHNTYGSWQCLCNNGWTGDGQQVGGCYDADDCEFSPCQHGGTCTDCGTLCLICDCIVGWRGKTCEIDWNECRMGIHTCHNFAICRNTPGSFDCDCEPGYSGDGYRMCMEVDDCKRWEDPQVRDGKMNDDSKLTDYAIKVRDGTGKIVKKEIPVTPAPWVDDIMVLDPDTALPVHQCGEWNKIARIWREHGACTDEGPAAFLCVCDEGWSDSNCDRDIDECARATDMCHKYGTCWNTPGSYYCLCNNGYTGDGITTCHDVDDCSYGPERCFAGRCTDLGPGDFRCVCSQGYMDRLCDRDINECADFTHTCQPEQVTDDGRIIPGAICKNTNGSFKCSCRAGFMGDGIGPLGCSDIDDCGSAPCENGACQDNGQLSYSCTCDYGWTNTNCDFDFNECITGAHDCHPEGKCVNTPGGYYCRCVSGHTGDGYTCTDLDDCDPDPCDPIHGTCSDNGANKYVCMCEIGFGGMGCEQDEVECMIGTHECHALADCFNTYGSYICVCKDENYGDGIDCAPCTQCLDPCADNEDFGICPGHADYNVNSGYDEDHMKSNPGFCPTSTSCGHGSGYINDVKRPPCAAIDRTCIQINECQLQKDNCDPEFAQCTDNEGSFICECKIVLQRWGTGLADECYPCTVCGLGKRMLGDCTSTIDRTCRMTIYDGNYAIETYSGATSQCLVHWKDAGKIFPERYSWGGRIGTPLNQGDSENGEGGYGSESVGKYEMWGGGEFGAKNKGIIPSPDVCGGDNEPICGVCNYNNLTPGENIAKGMEAAWTFQHLEDDLYMILNAADGAGFRCLGFETKDAPYPALLTWEGTTMVEDEGSCYETLFKGMKNETDSMVKPEEICRVDADCADGEHCKVDATEAGEWLTDLKGVSVKDLTKCEKEIDDGTMRDTKKNKAACELNYFCGFTTDEVGTAKEKMMANGGTVWNVKPMACQGVMCVDRWTEELYTIRTLATGDENMDDVIDEGDYRCLYFPKGIGAIPRMVPKAATADGVWLGTSKSVDKDNNGDPDCGIALIEGETVEEQNARMNAGGDKNIEGNTVHTEVTQEKELIINKQAVFKLVKIPNYGRGAAEEATGLSLAEQEAVMKMTEARTEAGI